MLNFKHYNINQRHLFTGKLDKSDWQLTALEKKIEENQAAGGGKEHHDNKVPKWNRDAFTDKVSVN